MWVRNGWLAVVRTVRPSLVRTRNNGLMPSSTNALGRAATLALEPNEARQGTTHHNMRYVLGISLGLIVVAFIVVYILFFAGSAPPTIPPPAA